MNTRGWTDIWIIRRLGPIIGGLVIVVLGGSMSLLWMRQEIEDTARATRAIETEIIKEERRLRYLDTKIAEIHQPLYLERQVRRLGLNLRPPSASQIVYLEGAPLHREPLPGDPDYTPPAQKDPFIRSIDLAVMEPSLKVD